MFLLCEGRIFRCISAVSFRGCWTFDFSFELQNTPSTIDPHLQRWSHWMLLEPRRCCLRFDTDLFKKVHGTTGVKATRNWQTLVSPSWRFAQWKRPIPKKGNETTGNASIFCSHRKWYIPQLRWRLDQIGLI